MVSLCIKQNSKALWKSTILLIQNFIWDVKVTMSQIVQTNINGCIEVIFLCLDTCSVFTNMQPLLQNKYLPARCVCTTADPECESSRGQSPWPCPTPPWPLHTAHHHPTQCSPWCLRALPLFWLKVTVHGITYLIYHYLDFIIKLVHFICAFLCCSPQRWLSGG